MPKLWLSAHPGVKSAPRKRRAATFMEVELDLLLSTIAWLSSDRRWWPLAIAYIGKRGAAYGSFNETAHQRILAGTRVDPYAVRWMGWVCSRRSGTPRHSNCWRQSRGRRASPLHRAMVIEVSVRNMRNVVSDERTCGRLQPVTASQALPKIQIVRRPRRKVRPIVPADTAAAQPADWTMR